MNLIALDLREFEPPTPLMKALEAAAALPESTTLRIHTRWRPMLLYAELDKRGYTTESEEQSDGSYLTDIRRK